MQLDRIDTEGRLYVLREGKGFSCYGFDVLDREGGRPGRKAMMSERKIALIRESDTFCGAADLLHKHGLIIHSVTRRGDCLTVDLRSGRAEVEGWSVCRAVGTGFSLAEALNDALVGWVTWLNVRGGHESLRRELNKRGLVPGDWIEIVHGNPDLRDSIESAVGQVFDETGHPIGRDARPEGEQS